VALLLWAGPETSTAALSALTGDEEAWAGFVDHGFGQATARDDQAVVERLMAAGESNLLAAGQQALAAGAAGTAAFVAGGYLEPLEKDLRLRVLRLTDSPGESVARAAGTAARGELADVVEFLVSGRARAEQADDQLRIQQIIAQGGQATQDAGNAALRGDAQDRQEFLTSGWELARARDAELESLTALAEQTGELVEQSTSHARAAATATAGVGAEYVRAAQQVAADAVAAADAAEEARRDSLAATETHLRDVLAEGVSAAQQEARSVASARETGAESEGQNPAAQAVAELLARARDAQASPETQLAAGRQAAAELAVAGSPWIQVASLDVLQGDAADLRRYLSAGLAQAIAQDERAMVEVIAQASPSEGERDAARELLETGSVEQISAFLADGDYPGRAADETTALLRLLDGAGPATTQGINRVVRGSEADRRAFLASGWSQAVEADAQSAVLQIAAEHEEPLDEVGVAAQVAIRGPGYYRDNFLQVEQYRAARRDVLAGVHQDRINALVAQIHQQVALTREQAARATAEVTGDAAVEDEALAQVARYAEQAATFAAQADRAAEEVAAGPQRVTAAVRATAEAVERATAMAEQQVQDVRWTMVAASRSLTQAISAYGAAGKARQDAVAAGQDAATVARVAAEALDQAVALQRQEPVDLAAYRERLEEQPAPVVESGLSVSALQALSISGPVEPASGTSGTPAVISGLRGEWRTAVVSDVLTIPYVGDLGEVVRYGDAARDHLAGQGRVPVLGESRPLVHPLLNRGALPGILRYAVWSPRAVVGRDSGNLQLATEEALVLSRELVLP
jgi:hypothetical protein